MAVPTIPDKFYFKIGEVSSLLGVKPYVVRFWETEFDLTPAKNRSRHRVYKGTKSRRFSKSATSFTTNDSRSREHRKS